MRLAAVAIVAMTLGGAYAVAAFAVMWMSALSIGG